MKTIIALLLVGLCTLAFAAQANVNQYAQQYKVADKLFLERQQNILRLLKYVLQSNYNQDQAAIAKRFNIEQQQQQYGNQQGWQEWIRYYQQGVLPRGQVFSIYNENQRQQAAALAQLLYSAKDYDTFYKTACWAREYVNEGMFVYALSVAVLHRQDTQGIILPPIYEIYPYYFVNSEVIDKAQQYKMKYGGNNQAKNEDVYYVQANYSGWYLNADPEQRDLAYFTEDIGLNAYYYYFNLDYPSWMGGEQYGLKKDKRGELFYYFYQQLLARYYLERLSNGYGSIPVYNWEGPIKTGYLSTLRYPNGLQFASRPAWSHLMYNPYNQAYTLTGEDNQFKIQEIQDYERRIRDAIDSGIVITEDGQKINIYGKDGLDVLGRIIDANPDSPNTRYYGYLQMIARQLLGYSAQPINDYQLNPSVLEQLETSLRDPVFYQLYKRIIYYFQRYKSNLPNYTQQQLNYPGVKIENVQVDKLVTYFDNFDFDISNALYLNEQEYQQDKFQVRARQYRLNNKPYTYQITVQSDKSQDVVVRAFLGPKYDEQGLEIPLNENRINYIELDKFAYKLVSGKNVININNLGVVNIQNVGERTGNINVENSDVGEINVNNAKKLRDNNCVCIGGVVHCPGTKVNDRTSYRALYKKVLSALEGQEEFQLDMSEAHNGFPRRLALPKGKVGGQAYQLYVYIGPYQPAQQKLSCDYLFSAGVGSGTRYIDNLPLGYPLDRPIVSEQDFYVPNSYLADVTIYHKSEKDINSSRY